jgi:uncharacterized protein
MRPKRVILDTNIWISYYIKARFTDLVNLIIDNDLLVLSSYSLIEELEEVLSRKKFAQYLNLPIADYIDFHKDLVKVYKTKLLYFESQDPKDNFLFDLALQHNASHIVTGDKKLLALGEVKTATIISLTAFKNLLV